MRSSWAEEAPELLPLPEQPYEAPEWKQCTVHSDCHLILNKCYYSIPYPYRGEKLWVRADLKLLRVYREHQLIKNPCPGLRARNLADR